jgi:hypothetical protein
MNNGGVIVVDDSFQGPDYDLPHYCFRGHLDVRRAVREFLIENQLESYNVGHLTIIYT